jgi:multidrug efflux system outer membrane protein
VRIAEADLASFAALSDAARADLFPRVTFNANILALVTDRASLVRNDGFGFEIGPAISWQGPDLRRVRARMDVADARASRAASVYESTVLGALAEAESALSAYAAEARRTRDLSAAAQAAERARDLADLRYGQGLDSFLDVLDAQRTLNDAQDRLVVNDAAQARRAVQIYRALGGIWMHDELKTYRSVAGSPP